MLLAFNITILVLFLMGYLLSLRRTCEWMNTIDKKEHRLYVLYPMAELLIAKTGLKTIVNRKARISQSLQALYVNSKPELEQKLFWCKRIALLISIMMAFTMLSLLGQLNNSNASSIVDEKYLMRPDFGEGSKEVVLDVTLENTAASTDKAPGISFEDVLIQVEERIYTAEEMDQVFEKAIRYLEQAVLSDNESSSAIYGDLYFPKEIRGTSIKVRWDPENISYITTDGTVVHEELDEKAVETTVTVVLTYLNYRKVHTMTFTLLPPKYSEEERMAKELSKAIHKSTESNNGKDRLELPITIENYRVIWNAKKEHTGTTLLLIGIFTAFLAWVMGDKELEKRMKKRREQMLMDYPEIMNKFTLLVNAGMTIKQAWYKIAEDYSTKLLQRDRDKRYAYEEMLLTANELKLGLSENMAYEQYGRRIGLIPYIKFGSLITQNLKKGNKGFTELLMQEAVEAFEERKEIAKRLGEEAGTKLLIPMMIMLILVFMIILIPAFWAFQI